MILELVYQTADSSFLCVTDSTLYISCGLRGVVWECGSLRRCGMEVWLRRCGMEVWLRRCGMGVWLRRCGMGEAV